jgi:hypothetical protein
MAGKWARTYEQLPGKMVTRLVLDADPATWLTLAWPMGGVLALLPMTPIRRSRSRAANRRRINLTDKGRLPAALEREFLCVHHQLVDLCILELEVDNYFASDCAVNVEHHRRSDVIYHHI